MAATFSYAQAAKGVAPTNSPAEPVASSNEQNAEVSAEQSTDAASTKVEPGPESENVNGTNDKEAESSSVGNSSTTSSTLKDEDEVNTPNGTSESTWDKQSQASGAEKATGEEEGADDKTDEKEKSVPAKELKAAPLPAVNIWHQRKEAQDAKAKALAALKPATKTGTSKTTSAASSTSGDHQQEPAKPPKKKGTDGQESAKERKKTEGGKGRDESASIPPVGDANLWPTPDVAQGEEKKKPQEKSDKSPVIRPHGKEKWMPVPYVPTAVFNTPLPSAARRGGRSARGGREGARNGTHGADKNASGQAGQGSAKQTTSADRGRNDTNSARANSLPAQSRRSNSVDAGLTDSRKHQAGRGPKGAENVNAAQGGKNVNGADTFPRHHRDAKQFAKGHEKGSDHHSRNPQLSVDTQAAPRSGSTRPENGPKSGEFTGFHDRKDKDFSRESRADRGRGSHRGGRGGHAGFNGAPNAHFPTNHMSHHNFMHPKSFGFGDRQRSQQHGPTNGSSGGHRMSLRSPSLPNSAAMYGVYPYPGDINTMYGYQPMHAGPMTAIPYQQYMEPFSLMSMLTMQLEYYFSVDNLCKDLFLRKHMDSQGFVALSFIASFKRVKTLTEDFNLLRHVSHQLRNVEYITGEDGIDRLRPRDTWEQWVLPLDQRDQSAQNEGPATVNVPKQDDATDFQNNMDGVNGSVVNGTVDSRASKTLLSSDAPEFSPSQSANAQTEVAHVRIPPIEIYP
ncbi:La domain family [Aspergillus brunneoviolaceus CBS 621.78]|uniref:HTH La-type RNA-binding domain-containing protein n=2 Tax=Aspergillus TaxID=5052 RepID=A0A8G1RYJ9_9EURO|nr:hypothetical protein BO95DRAFT_22787 [Aspergillus brunneoviolaceus CBS 621.78]XP_040806352.1 uncharacterized protein BO72DRAFT_464689 [Aspergillus fijiensis CBS 313.89]RAH40188.1 hypothetical protein BO95DRAFT_22787 [Aspergillus brunneoviolaceus CBS 621.78]RAK82342.1 hypothetical protein BO72DRAFT_464689 [Aspergillus fijiensis CBS 313.89]